MLATVHLVRHGEVHNPDHVVYADLEGFGLSELGRAQATSVARLLGELSIDVVVASPLRRAVETATPIGDALGVDPMTDDRLTEWRLAERWAGVGWEDLPRSFPGELEAYLATPGDIDFAPERLAEVAERVVAVVHELGRGRPGGAAVLVSHQDPIQAARLAMTGRDLDTLHHDKPGHATIVTIERARDGWTEVSMWSPSETSEAFPPVKGREGT